MPLSSIFNFDRDCAKQVLSGLGGLLLFAFGLFGTGAMVRPALPFPPVPTVREKVEWLDAHGDEYDTLFMGSSRVFNAILPDVFDRAMAEAGFPTHSFNLGVNAMRPPEDTFVLERALAKRRKPLKTLVLMAIQITVRTDDFRGSRRMAYWHDLNGSKAIFNELFDLAGEGAAWFPKDWRTYFTPAWRGRMWAKYLGKTLGLHVNLMLLGGHGANIGRGMDWADQLWGGAVREALGANGERQDGYDTHHAPDDVTDADWQILTKQIADYKKNPIEPGYGSAESQRQLREKQKAVARFGGRVVLFEAPDAKTFQLIPDPAQGPPIPVLDFGNPILYPELFERKNRRDLAHLNAAGSGVFTRLLANEFARLLKDEEAGVPAAPIKAPRARSDADATDNPKDE